MQSLAVARGILALLALSFFASAVHAREIMQEEEEGEGFLEDLLHHDDDADDTDGAISCQNEPPEGDWMVEHRFPSAPGNDTLAFQIRALLPLRKVLDNVYQGTAGGVVINAELPILNTGDPVAYSFSGIWDQETCTMSGTIVQFDQLIADPAQLRYNEETQTLVGPYLNTDAGTVLFSRTGIYTLIFMES